MYSYFFFIFSLIQRNKILPSVGSSYKTIVHVPLIGTQTIETTMITDNTAFIKLNGMINENGTARYIYNDKKEIVYLSWNLRKIMKKFKSEFSFPFYDIENDIIVFNLKVKPIFFNKKIKLKNIITFC